MDNIDIRAYILDNFKNESIEKIKDSIETTIKMHDEDALIGLGVLYEIVWNHLTKEEQNHELSIIYDYINK